MVALNTLFFTTLSLSVLANAGPIGGNDHQDGSQDWDDLVVNISPYEDMGVAGDNTAYQDIGYHVNGDSPARALLAEYHNATGSGNRATALYAGLKLAGLLTDDGDLMSDIKAHVNYYASRVPVNVAKQVTQYQKRDTINSTVINVLSTFIEAVGTTPTTRETQQLVKRGCNRNCGYYHVDCSNGVWHSVWNNMLNNLPNDGGAYGSSPRSVCVWMSDGSSSYRSCMSWETDIGSMSHAAIYSWAWQMEGCYDSDDDISFKSLNAFGINGGYTYVCGSDRPDGC